MHFLSRIFYYTESTQNPTAKEEKEKHQRQPLIISGLASSTFFYHHILISLPVMPAIISAASSLTCQRAFTHTHTRTPLVLLGRANTAALRRAPIRHSSASALANVGYRCSNRPRNHGICRADRSATRRRYWHLVSKHKEMTYARMPLAGFPYPLVCCSWYLG